MNILIAVNAMGKVAMATSNSQEPHVSRWRHNGLDPTFAVRPIKERERST